MDATYLKSEDETVILECFGEWTIPHEYQGMKFVEIDKEEARKLKHFLQNVRREHAHDVIDLIERTTGVSFDGKDREVADILMRHYSRGSIQDCMLVEGKHICKGEGYASAALLQRKLRIGYPRAARIVDQMISDDFCESVHENGRYKLTTGDPKTPQN